MNLNINGKDYELHFGLDFIAALDRKYVVSQSGFQIGQGLTMVTSYIEMGNPTILTDLIQAATITEKSKPTVPEIKQFLEHDVQDLEGLMNDFLSALETNAMTGLMMKKMKKATEKAEKLKA